MDKNRLNKLLQKATIAIELLNLLIENHEDGDSLVRESDLIERLEDNHSFTPTTSEITNSVDFINSQCNQETILEGWIGAGGILSSDVESKYTTDAPVRFLRELIELIR